MRAVTSSRSASAAAVSGRADARIVWMMSKRRSARRMPNTLKLTERCQFDGVSVSCKSKERSIRMPSIHIDVINAEWTTAVPFYGPERHL